MKRFRIPALSLLVLVLSTACHGVIAAGPGVPPEGAGPLTNGLWEQTYTFDWKPVGQGGVSGSPTYQFELEGSPDHECNHIGCWPLLAKSWQGYVRVPVEGDYTINNYADDGARIWIDGKVALANWGMGGFFGGNSVSSTIHLTSGDHPYYEEYYNANGLEADTSTSIPGTTWVKPRRRSRRQAAQRRHARRPRLKSEPVQVQSTGGSGNQRYWQLLSY